jgi:hypothetical protein
MSDQSAPGEHGASPAANMPAPTGFDEVSFGHFGSVAGGEVWELAWAPDTGAVQAREISAGYPSSTAGGKRFLGRVPTVDYVRDLITAITRTHGGDGWRSTHGIDELTRWLRMLGAALDGEVWTWPAPLHQDLSAYYLDYDHTRDLIDSTDLELAARELWEDVDELSAQARDTARVLMEGLSAGGTLAQAARAAQELVDVAIALHLVLNDAYHVAHQRFPGRRSSADRPPIPPAPRDIGQEHGRVGTA